MAEDRDLSERDMDARDLPEREVEPDDTTGAVTDGPPSDETTSGEEVVEVEYVREPLTRRQLLWRAVAVLSIALVVLIAFLLLYRPVSPVIQGGEAVSGLRPELVIEGPGTGKLPAFSGPMAAAWGAEGRIYVADTNNHRVCVFDRRGRFLFEFGTFGIAKPLPGTKPTWKKGSLNYPTGIAVDASNGEVYVADFNNNTIEVFSADGTYLRNFPDPAKVTGKGGSGFDGTGIAVTDVAVSDGRVYATDAYQVFVFDRSGKLLKQFGKPGAGPGDLDRPNGIVVGDGGVIIVSDSNHSRLVKFDQRGRPILVLGTKVTDVDKTTTNPFLLPRGLSVLEDGSAIVADPLSMQLVRVDTTGKVTGQYGRRGDSPAEFNFPNDVDADGKVLLVADRGNDRVQVVRVVGK